MKRHVKRLLGIDRRDIMLAQQAAQQRAIRIRESDHVRFAMGAMAAPIARNASNAREAEFRAFSQFGEDGILQWLLAHVPIARETFVELGVGDYRESNTRFLLEHDNWKGLAVDAEGAHVRYLAESGLDWRHGIAARVAFVTRDNVNDLLADATDEFTGDIGILSIDLDGVDYWVIEALTVATPRILIVEYNSLWGARSVSIPYSAGFSRGDAHFSWLYFGASLSAFCYLLSRRGYRLVGSSSAGQNAFFVREDVAGDLPSIDAAAGWREARFRESRDEDGALSYIDNRIDRLALIGGMPLVDVSTGAHLRVSELVTPNGDS